jgi:hypothetical protein
MTTADAVKIPRSTGITKSAFLSAKNGTLKDPGTFRIKEIGVPSTQIAILKQIGDPTQIGDP